MAIQSFADALTEDLWNGVANSRIRRIPSDVRKSTARKLDMLHAAAILSDLLAPPGNRLEQLRGDLAGKHSVRINDHWRLVFRWTDAGPAEVQLIDYH